MQSHQALHEELSTLGCFMQVLKKTEAHQPMQPQLHEMSFKLLNAANMLADSSSQNKTAQVATCHFLILGVVGVTYDENAIEIL